MQNLNNICKYLDRERETRELGKKEFQNKVEEYKKNNNGKINLETYSLLHCEYLSKYVINTDYKYIKNEFNNYKNKIDEDSNQITLLKKLKELEDMKDYFRCLLIMVDLHPNMFSSYVDSYTTDFENKERITVLVSNMDNNFDHIRSNPYYVSEKMCLDTEDNPTKYKEFYFDIPQEYLYDFECIKNSKAKEVSDKYKDLMKLKLGETFLEYFIKFG